MNCFGYRGNNDIDIAPIYDQKKGSRADQPI